eukprot:COSAG02_NODE_983_length_15470_cov_4.269924_7_plen_97_part_00
MNPNKSSQVKSWRWAAMKPRWPKTKRNALPRAIATGVFQSIASGEDMLSSGSNLLPLLTGENEAHVLGLEVRVFVPTFDRDTVPPAFGQPIPPNCP